MSRPHLAAGCCFLALAAFLGWEATKLGYYSPLGPGAGFFPLWLSGALGLLALFVVVAAARGRFGRDVSVLPPAPAAAWQLVAVVAGLVFVVATLDTLGFLIAMALFCTWSMVALGCRSPAQIILVALLGSVGSKALFVDLLGVALPGGRLGW